MADAIELGVKAGQLTVWLSRRGDFVAGLDAITAEGDDREWPLGTQFSLNFYENKGDEEPAATWPADVNEGRAGWHIPLAQVRAEVIRPNLKTAALIYTSDAGVILDIEEGIARWT